MLGDLAALLGLAMLLGIRHGFDADHLAAIDGLARVNASAGRPRLARASGLLFSAGHGGVVLVAALALRQGTADLPSWLDRGGTLVSIGFLSVLGMINLRDCLGAGPAASRGVIAPWMLRARWSRHPASAVLIGAAFAISLDTLSGAAWFGVAGARHGGAAGVLALGAVFVAGMMVADTLNGLWIAGLIQRSNRMAWRARRAFSAGLAALSFLIAGIGAVRLASPAVDAWMEPHALAMGMLLLVTVGFSFVLLGRVSAPRRS